MWGHVERNDGKEDTERNNGGWQRVGGKRKSFFKGRNIVGGIFVDFATDEALDLATTYGTVIKSMLKANQFPLFSASLGFLCHPFALKLRVFAVSLSLSLFFDSVDNDSHGHKLRLNLCGLFVLFLLGNLGVLVDRLKNSGENFVFF
ncbi:hypothetical protein V6N12_012189 [Hibiscus sabdariffa]|uniref:Uncharacterized protein n=1 Tax=Hibiscus sabdariffa TaxID=183260 RepID=A0ABR2CJ62_9ROSI